MSTDLVDLEIRVTTPWGQEGPSFKFELHSTSGTGGFHHETIPGLPVNDPKCFKQEIFDQLDRLHQCIDQEGAVLSGEEILQEVEGIGHDLYQMLFPREMQTIYRENCHRIRTLSLTSDEPWIPWEMLFSGEPDDDFLCMKFPMSRWLAGSTSLLPSKQVRRIVTATAGKGSGLRQANREVEWLHEMSRAIAGLDEPVSATKSPSLFDILKGADFELLHYAGHGEHVPEAGGDRIVVEEQSFRLRRLPPRAEKRLRESRPLVFFNSCQAGRLTHSLTGLDGWAARWIQRCGCGAFVAPNWPVDDERAFEFAKAFYTELADGSTLGEAVFKARHRLRNQAREQIEWLAYSLYGHVNARITFGGNRESVQEPRLSPKPSPRPTVSVHAEPSRRPRVSRGPRRPTKQVPKILIGLAILGLLAASGSWLTEKWRSTATEPQPITGSTTLDGVKPAEPSPTKETPAIKDPPPESPPPPPPPPPTPARSDPMLAIPMLPLVPGKIGIAVLDRETRQLDRDLTDAVEAIFLESTGNLAPFSLRSQDSKIIEDLMNGKLQPSTDGRSPWGAEHLLLATASRKPIPQANPQFTAFTVTLSARLLAMPDGATKLRTNQTHNGLGASPEAALQQASERCLRETTNFFEGEKDVLDTK